MDTDDKRFTLFCHIVQGMIANTNGGNVVWGNLGSQSEIITLAKGMSLMAFPEEVQVDSVPIPAPVDAVAEEIPTEGAPANG